MKKQSDSDLIQMLIDSTEDLHHKMDIHAKSTLDISQRLEHLEKSLISYKGFVGGIIFVVSSIATLFVFLFDRLKS